MNFEQLILAENQNAITAEEKTFVDLHKQIMYYGKTAADYAVGMYGKLKEMRDGKNYLAAGFESFGAYVENAVGIKERQAYNYIKVYEELPEEILQSNAKLGVTKLALLAGLPAEARNEIIENNKPEDVSVRKLRELVEEKKALIAEKDNQIAQLQMEIADKGDVNNTAADEARQKAEAEAQKLRDKLAKKEDEKAKLAEEIKALKNAPAEVKTVPDPATESKLADAQRELGNKETEIETLKKQLTVASDADMSKFKVKFEDFQRLGGEMINLIAQMDDEKQAKCKTAIKSVIKGWQL